MIRIIIAAAFALGFVLGFGLQAILSLLGWLILGFGLVLIFDVIAGIGPRACAARLAFRSWLRRTGLRFGFGIRPTRTTTIWVNI